MRNRLFFALSYGGRSSQNVLVETGHRSSSFSQEVETSKAQQPHSSQIRHKNLFHARQALKSNIGRTIFRLPTVSIFFYGRDTKSLQ